MALHNMTVEIHQGKRIARFNFCAEGNCWYHFRIFEDGKVIATGKGRTIEKIYPRMVKYLKAQQTEPATPPASVDLDALIATDSMPIPYSPDHDANERRYGFGDMEHAPCRICGRPVNLAAPATKMIHEHLGGGMIVTERLAALLPAASDLGMQVIGPECWCNHPEIARFLNK